MTVIFEDVKKVIESSKICFLATINEDNTPNLSPKGSLKLWDNEHLIFANIASFQSIANILKRPDVCINVVDFFKRRGYSISGKASVLLEGSLEFEHVSQSFWNSHGRSYPIHSVVKIKVTQINDLHSPAYDYGDQVTEEKLSAHFHTLYSNGSK